MKRLVRPYWSIGEKQTPVYHENLSGLERRRDRRDSVYLVL